MIPCLIPDMPTANELAPWLTLIDEQRWYTNFGPLLRRFEEGLGALLRPRAPAALHLATFSSASTALELTLSALGLPPGARVLLPALTFPATALAVTRAGGVPVLCDVDPSSWALTPALAEEALAHGELAAVLPVAPFGHPLEVADWDAFSRRHQLPVVIDAAGAVATQGLGEQCHVVFSLHATKPHGIGEGGVVVSGDEGLVSRARALANFGFTGDRVEGLGCNGKVSEYHAAVGLAQLDRWPRVEARRREVWHAYAEALHPLAPAAAPRPATGTEPPAVLCLRLKAPAAEVATALGRRGVESRRWYLPPLHRHPRFAECPRLGPGGGPTLPVTEGLADTLLGLPFHSLMSGDQVRAVCRTLADTLAETLAGETLDTPAAPAMGCAG